MLKNQFEVTKEMIKLFENKKFQVQEFEDYKGLKYTITKLD